MPGLATFFIVSIVLIITPGPDMALVTKNALLYGRQAALATAIGVNIGLATWTMASALGIAAVVAASATAFTVLKVLGAAYLIFLGVQMLRHSRRATSGHAPEGAVRRSGTPHRSCLLQGILSNLMNPKMAIFFTSFIPQFVGPGDPVAATSLRYGVIFNLMTVVWLLTYAIVTSQAGSVLRRPSVKVVLDRLTGCVFIGFGLRLAGERR